MIKLSAEKQATIVVGHPKTKVHSEIQAKKVIAGSPPISLSLIVGRSQCDAEASVTPQIIIFLPEEVP